MKTTLTWLLFLTLGIQYIFGQDNLKNDNPKKMQFSIEIDPATFFMSGYSLHLQITTQKL